jgi:threonine synthase
MEGKSIRYYSTNRKSPLVSFREALLEGLAPDGGLYMPDVIPGVNPDEMLAFRSKEYHEIATSILRIFLGEEIDTMTLSKLCRDAYNFLIPIEKVYDRNYILRLDQGPTASFKDFAARIMARLMNYFLSGSGSHITILAATSGDTGSAVANAFHGLENIDVVILFPEEEVSHVQRKQMTTLSGNIRTIAVAGKFDDCQGLVKRAFRDKDLSDLSLSSANSINIGRLLPQSVFYFYAWSRMAESFSDEAVFSVPSGNFGNLMGGLIARQMGLPASRFIVASNKNDEVPKYLETGIYRRISPSYNCISSAMNVGHPSNLARIIDLFGGMMDEHGTILREPELELMKKCLTGISISDKETINAIQKCYRESGILLEPHGAVAWKALEYFHENEKEQDKNRFYVSLETAHPSKFADEIEEIVGFYPETHPSLSGITIPEENFYRIENDYLQLKKFLYT